MLLFAVLASGVMKGMGMIGDMVSMMSGGMVGLLFICRSGALLWPYSSR